MTHPPDLFDNDPAFNTPQQEKQKRLRNHRGQFCSQEQQRIDRIEHENQVLRIKVQRYLRAWHAAACQAAKAERELLSLKKQYNYEQNHIQQQGRNS